MTTPQEDAELRDEIVVLFFNMLSFGKTIAEVSKIPERELARGEAFIDEVMQLIKARDEQREREIRLSELQQLEFGYQIANADGVFSIDKHLEIRRRELANPQEQDKEEE